MSKKAKGNPIYPEEKPKKVREKFNWKPYVIVLAVIAVILGGVAAKVYLFDGYFVLKDQVELEYDRTSGSYLDAEKGITYRPISPCFEPASIVQEPVYSRIGGISLFRPGSWDEIGHLYALCYPVGDRADKKYERADPTVWLAADEAHGSTVYCNSDYNPPEPQNFEVDTVYLCDADGKIATQELDSLASVRLIREFFDESSENLYSSSEFMSGELIKTVRVTSTRYYWLHLVLYLYADGENYYLFLPEQRRYVQTDSEVFDVYFATPDDLQGAAS